MKIDLFRHAQSELNVGVQKRNINLTDVGIQQAKELTGDYDIVIVSELKRAQQTLEHSKITFKHKIITKECSEIGEPWETSKQFRERVRKFHSSLKAFEPTQRVAVITHYFFIMTMTGYALDNAEKIEWDPNL